ncbi:LADA_0F00584g1_1 [Lachancea dasiensis]|uniref:LADA_0F00584g1_1 n=1 Tax=Lachancea dasiensis TaxID=1072105 RepID=A0A1G4JHN1_9SACH|nr:LADA_0F00584g1_1 [Lachancea dasiensis]
MGVEKSCYSIVEQTLVEIEDSAGLGAGLPYGMTRIYPKNWISQLQLAYRNCSRQRRFTYKQNAPRLDRARMQWETSKNPNCENSAPQTTIELPARLESMPVLALQEVLWKDVILRVPSRIQFVLRAHGNRSQDCDLQQLPVMQSLFKNSIKPRYELSESRGRRGAYLEDSQGWDDVLRLQTSNHMHIDILWPALKLSLACRAVEVPSETYKQLQNQSVYHPVTGDAMPIFESQSGSNQAIALTPQLNAAHAKLFPSDLLASVVIPSRVCNNAELRALQKLCVSPTGSHVTTQKQTPRPFKTADGFETEIRSTSRFFRALESGSFRPNTRIMKRRMCTTDVLRAVVLSNSITEQQLKEEYCKVSIVYCIYENLRRIKNRINDIEPSGAPTALTPWDSQILRDINELNENWDTTSIQSLVNSKDLLDAFLVRLNIYNVMINAELRSSAKQAPAMSEKRQRAILQVLSTVLAECKGFQDLFPNLYFELKLFTDSIDRASMVSTHLPEQTESSRRVFDTVMAIVGMEDSTIANGSSTQNFKAVLLVDQSLPADIARLYQFSSRLELQITDSLDAVTKVKNAECVAKQMIDHATILYLMKRPGLGDPVALGASRRRQ